MAKSLSSLEAKAEYCDQNQPFYVELTNPHDGTLKDVGEAAICEDGTDGTVYLPDDAVKNLVEMPRPVWSMAVLDTMQRIGSKDYLTASLVRLSQWPMGVAVLIIHFQTQAPVSRLAPLATEDVPESEWLSSDAAQLELLKLQTRLSNGFGTLVEEELANLIANRGKTETMAVMSPNVYEGCPRPPARAVVDELMRFPPGVIAKGRLFLDERHDITPALVTPALAMKRTVSRGEAEHLRLPPHRHGGRRPLPELALQGPSEYGRKVKRLTMKMTMNGIRRYGQGSAHVRCSRTGWCTPLRPRVLRVALDSERFDKANPHYKGDACKRWGQACIQGARVAGRDIDLVRNYKEWLEEIGFVDVVERHIPQPGAPWHVDSRLRRIGQYTLHNGLQAAGAVWPLLRASGMTAEGADGLVEEMKREISDHNNHGYSMMSVMLCPVIYGLDIDANLH
ncbi:hypothetical protein BX600DRAFT_526009 [Xylariales sp. PMI_506]|nr:hypothetical protein BX600DRAFT_526009 [Xylariales sp. PMI_506]